MGILSSLGHPANGDTVGENLHEEAEEESVEDGRPAWESERALVGMPGKPRGAR
jgi:hypothetical protein